MFEVIEIKELKAYIYPALINEDPKPSEFKWK